MRYLTLVNSNIDPASYARYQCHLDQIEARLAPDLYRMLRFPEQAYLDGATFYDSTVVEWRELLSLDDRRKVTQVRVVGPNQDREYLFTLQDAVTTVTSAGPVFRLGQLYCVEVAWSADDGFSLSLVYVTRVEIQVSCATFAFEVRS